MIQCVVVVFRVFRAQRVATDDQLQPVSSLRDERHGQAAVKVPRPHVVHLNRWRQNSSVRSASLCSDPHEPLNDGGENRDDPRRCTQTLS